MNKRLLGLLLLSASYILVSAGTCIWSAKYFPIGTKWTELRLDTTKYDNWYTKSGDEWVPNFEQINYYVKDVFPLDRTVYDYPYDMLTIYCQREGKADSLCYLVNEYQFYDDDGIPDCDIVQASIPYFNKMLYPQYIYRFGDWNIGTYLSTRRLRTSVSSVSHSKIGFIEDLEEDYLGGEKKVRYAITDLGHHVIEGIGVTAWAGANCIFGPSEIGEALGIYYPGESPYCTILVHFERNGEVLYNIWPEPGKENTIGRPAPSPSLGRGAVYDLQGRRLNNAPQKGLYIENGKKTIIR